MVQNLKAELNIENGSSIVILTGSGISAESGIPTFRDAKGLWDKYDLEKVATPAAFANNPELVHEFYNLRRGQLNDENIKPNKAHEAITKLENNWQGNLTLITQNVDDLHERAGTKDILHMHGELRKIRCVRCSHIAPWTDDLSIDHACQNCTETGGLRPHIVWFGEMPIYMDVISSALDDCDLFISIGTSGSVYPAAGFVHEANMLGARTIEINLEPSANAAEFTKGFYGRAGVKVPECVESLLA